MARALGAVSDKLLGILLKEKRAGACVVEDGQCFLCDGGLVYFYNCQGACVYRAGARCLTC